MNEEILINITPQETRVALIQQGAVQELQIERTRQRGIVGNIYLAKVVRVLPGMQSAFIEIGLERTAFMHVADITQNNPQAQIEKLLFEGQSFLEIPGCLLGESLALCVRCYVIAHRV